MFATAEITGTPQQVAAAGDLGLGGGQPQALDGRLEAFAVAHPGQQMQVIVQVPPHAGEVLAVALADACAQQLCRPAAPQRLIQAGHLLAVQLCRPVAGVVILRTERPMSVQRWHGGIAKDNGIRIELFAQEMESSAARHQLMR